MACAAGSRCCRAKIETKEGSERVDLVGTDFQASRQLRSQRLGPRGAQGTHVLGESCAKVSRHLGQELEVGQPIGFDKEHARALGQGRSAAQFVAVGRANGIGLASGAEPLERRPQLAG
ncbi:MAG TPA: hypothetical protein VMK12_13625, partial [Anaeromyxobacteraceae bacterium]|nr:hypothetical protein [Anaeromyxobacteraceae bacterium]